MRLAALLILATAAPVPADDAKKWVTIKGRVIFDKAAPIPVMAVIIPGPLNAGCNANGPFTAEDFIVDPKTRALANVVVWIEPEENKRAAPFPKAMLHPSFAQAKPAAHVIDQPCCMFVPRVTAAREGDTLTIKNSAAFTHNANFNSVNNGVFNVLIPPGGAFNPPAALAAEKNPIVLGCNIHGWMGARVAVFDHPYFAVTKHTGEFEIKLAPVGKFKLYVRHERGFTGGVLGATKPQVIELEAGKTLDLGDIEFK